MSLVLQGINKQYIATNNGLEQVYQNKLVEGRDYERWDWLKGDGLAWIDTLHKCSTTINVDVLINADYVTFADYIGAENSDNSGNLRIGVENSTGRLGCVRYNGSKVKFVAPNTDANIVVGGGYVSVNGTKQSFNTLVSSYNITIGGVNKRNTVKGNPCNFRYVNISDVDYSLYLSPIKLLSPCPPNLSANGKPYPIGECGMIDSISGKFYGNSGSGSFSVYNDPTE